MIKVKLNMRSTQKNVYKLFVILSIIVYTNICFSQTNWEWVNPLPQGNNLNSVIYGNGIFMAVGGKGTVLTSSDGVAWNVKNTGKKNISNLWLMVMVCS
jgi:hypothetical protein